VTGVVALALVLVAACAGTPRERVVAAAVGPSLLPAALDTQRRHDERTTRAADLARYTRRVAEDPASAADWVLLAALRLQAARDAGDPDGFRAAESAARRSLALRTDRNAKAMMLLASALLAQHRFAEALAWADSSVARAPEVTSFRALQFELQVELGRYAAADSTARALLGQRTHPAVAPRLARWFELRGQPDTARRLLLAARATADTARGLPAEQRGWFHLRVADFALRHGDLAGAGAALARGIAAVPGDARLQQAAVRWHALDGRPARALALADSMAESLDLATSAFAATVARAVGDRVAAARWLARVEALNRAAPEPYARGWTLARLEAGVHLPETRARLEREIRERPDVYGWDQLAMARLLTGDIAGARAASDRALALGTTDASLLWHAARIADAAGDRARGAALTRRALAMNPTFHAEDVARAQARLREEG
jgi:Tfp pilus assembly protein PilF